MKKKIGLHTTPDFLTRHTEDLWNRTKECIAEGRHQAPLPRGNNAESQLGLAP